MPRAGGSRHDDGNGFITMRQGEPICDASDSGCGPWMKTALCSRLRHRACFPYRRQRHLRLEGGAVFLPRIGPASGNQPLQGEPPSWRPVQFQGPHHPLFFAGVRAWFSLSNARDAMAAIPWHCTKKAPCQRWRDRARRQGRARGRGRPTPAHARRAGRPTPTRRGRHQSPEFA